MHIVSINLFIQLIYRYFVYIYIIYYTNIVIIIMRLLCIQIYTFWHKVYEHTSKYKQYDIYGVLNFNLFSRLFQYNDSKYQKCILPCGFREWTRRIFYSAYDNNSEWRLPVSAKTFRIRSYINAFTYTHCYIMHGVLYNIGYKKTYL